MRIPFIVHIPHCLHIIRSNATCTTTESFADEGLSFGNTYPASGVSNLFRLNSPEHPSFLLRENPDPSNKRSLYFPIGHRQACDSDGHLTVATAYERFLGTTWSRNNLF
jgi:hypothetical protein